MSWVQTRAVATLDFKCSYCNNLVAPSVGYVREINGAPTGRVLICPKCDNPTYFNREKVQFPGPIMGESVAGITDDEVAKMYLEARRCSSVGAYTACVMACRKILMNVAVHQGADENKSFLDYVNFLESKNYIPPNGRAWVDEIRKRGNTATHEIKVMNVDDAEVVLEFTTMLLRFVYEMPAKLAKGAAKK